jgi:hypothetical protein
MDAEASVGGDSVAGWVAGVEPTTTSSRCPEPPEWGALGAHFVRPQPPPPLHNRSGGQSRRRRLKSDVYPMAGHRRVHSGAVAQLGERCVRNAEVEGSTPFRSTCDSSLQR